MKHLHSLQESRGQVVDEGGGGSVDVIRRIGQRCRHLLFVEGSYSVGQSGECDVDVSDDTGKDGIAAGDGRGYVVGQVCHRGMHATEGSVHESRYRVIDDDGHRLIVKV